MVGPARVQRRVVLGVFLFPQSGGRPARHRRAPAHPLRHPAAPRPRRPRVRAPLDALRPVGDVRLLPQPRHLAPELSGPWRRLRVDRHVATVADRFYASSVTIT